MDIYFINLYWWYLIKIKLVVMKIVVRDIGNCREGYLV